MLRVNVRAPNVRVTTPAPHVSFNTPIPTVQVEAPTVQIEATKPLVIPAPIVQVEVEKEESAEDEGMIELHSCGSLPNNGRSILIPLNRIVAIIPNLQLPAMETAPDQPTIGEAVPFP